MLNGKSEQLYVAELKVPSLFYSTSETRGEIPKPSEFGISKGYYVILPRDEHSVVSGHAEVVLVIEFLSPGLLEAEARAISMGEVFSSLLSAFGAFPLQSSQLQRIACMDVNDDLRTEHNYAYRDRPYMLTEFDQVSAYRLAKYIRLVASIDVNTRGQLQSAIHWYGLSVSAQDPTVSYVAAWTGLECIGTAIDRIAHPYGPKAPCKTCGNVPGEDRDRKKAGIEHMVCRLSDISQLSESLSDDVKERLSKELTGSFSSTDAQKLRDAIVHGLEGIGSLVHRVSESRLHLIHVLNASIQIVMGGAAKSWMPGAGYWFHPDGRYSLRFKPGLKVSPYLNEWASELRLKEHHVILEPENLYVKEHEFEFAINEHASRFAESQCEEPFKRDDDVYRLSHDPKWLDCPTWYDRPAELDWAEYSSPLH